MQGRKKMKKVLGTILFVVYAIIAILVTVLLLTYNDYNNSEIGDYTVYIVTDDSLEPEYKQGSILLIKGTNDRNVQVGDEIFMYKVLNSSEYEVISTTLQAKTQQGTHTVYVVDNEESYASDYFIGKVDDTIVIEGWGYLLSILESRWGYLFCIVVVSLLLFLQEVFELVMEIKYLNQKKKKGAIEVVAEDEDEYDEDEYDEDEYDEDEYENRKKLIENDKVEAIIVLPRDMFYTTDISVTLWILNNNKKAGTINGRKVRDRSGEILFVDLRTWNENIETYKLDKGTKKKVVLTDNQINEVKKIYDTWQSEETDGNNYEVPELYRSVNIKEIEEKNYTLTPSKYIEFIDHDLDIDYEKEMARIQEEMREILKQEKKSQLMLEEAFKGIGYDIKKD